ncbi:MAG TPA: phosphatase PAP2 family protein [Alphaproteobacteria bacterium]|nr:phosphatase PAP2 family protein [Alphaproteobacteria bacterium]
MTDRQSRAINVDAGPGDLTGFRAAINDFGATCVETARSHFLFIAIIVVYAALAVIVGRLTGYSHVVNVEFYGTDFLVVLSAFAVVLTLGHTIWMTVIVRPGGRLYPAIFDDYRRRFVRPKRIAAFLLVVCLSPFFFSAFSSFKRMIPYYSQWHWDATFKDWDKWLHFGRHPWEWTHAVFGSPAASGVISFGYNVWYFVIFFTFIWQAWNTNQPRLRTQYLYSSILTWIILGTVLATALASAGPVYYGRVVGGTDPFAPLMRRLYEINAVWEIWTLPLPIQEKLWAIHESKESVLGSGISAMPSLHVATTTLAMILAWKFNKVAGIVMSLFVVMIQIGSVHLGWHYAIDGYLSFALVFLIWFGVGRVIDWWERRKVG